MITNETTATMDSDERKKSIIIVIKFAVNCRMDDIKWMKWSHEKCVQRWSTTQGPINCNLKHSSGLNKTRQAATQKFRACVRFSNSARKHVIVCVCVCAGVSSLRKNHFTGYNRQIVSYFMERKFTSSWDRSVSWSCSQVSRFTCDMHTKNQHVFTKSNTKL